MCCIVTKYREGNIVNTGNTIKTLRNSAYVHSYVIFPYHMYTGMNSYLEYRYLKRQMQKTKIFVAHKGLSNLSHTLMIT